MDKAKEPHGATPTGRMELMVKPKTGQLFFRVPGYFPTSLLLVASVLRLKVVMAIHNTVVCQRFARRNLNGLKERSRELFLSSCHVSCQRSEPMSSRRQVIDKLLLSLLLSVFFPLSLSSEQQIPELEPFRFTPIFPTSTRLIPRVLQDPAITTFSNLLNS